MAQRDDAFTVFARAHSTGLLRLAVAFGLPRGQAEDAVQNALERVYVRWVRLGDPLAYARQVIVNGSRDSWRHRQRHPEVTLAAVVETGMPDETGARSWQPWPTGR